MLWLSAEEGQGLFICFCGTLLGIYGSDDLEEELETIPKQTEQDLPLIYGDEIDPEELCMASQELKQ